MLNGMNSAVSCQPVPNSELISKHPLGHGPCTQGGKTRNCLAQREQKAPSNLLGLGAVAVVLGTLFKTPVHPSKLMVTGVDFLAPWPGVRAGGSPSLQEDGFPLSPSSSAREHLGP